MSEKKIYLPDDKAQGILIDNAWQEFQEQMKDYTNTLNKN